MANHIRSLFTIYNYKRIIITFLDQILFAIIGGSVSVRKARIKSDPVSVLGQARFNIEWKSGSTYVHCRSNLLQNACSSMSEILSTVT